MGKKNILKKMNYIKKTPSKKFLICENQVCDQLRSNEYEDEPLTQINNPYKKGKNES